METVLIAGGTGLIGSHLSALLAGRGYTVLHLSRQRDPGARFPAYQWDLAEGTIDDEAVQRADYVINLAGAGVADERWTDSRKKTIIRSRTDGARLLRSAFERLDHRPRAYLSASGVNYYGESGDKVLHETDPPGEGFLSETSVHWEEGAWEVSRAGIRTVILRTGIVLSTRGGALKQMLLPLKFFTSTYFGDGRQWYSWIHLDDICRLYIHAMENETMEGVYNAVAPNPVRNRALAEALPPAADRRALVVPAPAPALYLTLGEMAHAVLDSVRCSAEKIEGTGFTFVFPELSQALEDLFRRKL